MQKSRTWFGLVVSFYAEKTLINKPCKKGLDRASREAESSCDTDRVRQAKAFVVKKEIE